MAKFTSTGDHSVALKEVDLPDTESKRLHLVDMKVRTATDIKLVFDSNIKASIKSSPFDGPKGIWIVDIKGVANGKTTLKAQFDDKTVASVDIEVFTKVMITLPLEKTEQGMLTRLFLAESINPGNNVLYNEKESKTGMIWMRQVIENRLKHKTPNIFGATKPTRQAKYTINDIVKAKNQFHGFENYPNTLTQIKININGFIAIANNYNHSKRKLYVNFIENARIAASRNALRGFTDPSSKGLYGWRTKGASAPGGNFKQYKDLAGQTFYTLK